MVGRMVAVNNAFFFLFAPPNEAYSRPEIYPETL